MFFVLYGPLGCDLNLITNSRPDDLIGVDGALEPTIFVNSISIKITTLLVKSHNVGILTKLVKK